jgi:hypothetical protein
VCVCVCVWPLFVLTTRCCVAFFYLHDVLKYFRPPLTHHHHLLLLLLLLLLHIHHRTNHHHTGMEAVSNAERREQKLKVGKDEILKQAKDKSQLLTKLESGSKDLENAARNEDKHIWPAMVWLRENKDQFKMDVYEPILLHLRVPDKSNSKCALPLLIHMCASEGGNQA